MNELREAVSGMRVKSAVGVFGIDVKVIKYLLQQDELA